MPRDVPLDFPASLSPSRANDFLTCPLMFRLRSIDRIPEAPSPAAVRGSLVHRALELLFALPARDRDSAAAQVLLTEAWGELTETEPESARALADEIGGHGGDVVEAVLARARPLLDAYFTMEDPTRLEPHARELGVSVEIQDGFSIRGFVDRIDRTPDGDIRIVDYKTGRSPRTGYETKAMFQMRFYALAWWRMTGQIPRLLQLMYLGNREFLRYEPTADELEATERKILALRSAIEQAAREDAFTPTPSRLCDWCSFQHLCPAFGNQPPPLPPPPWPNGTRDPA